MLASLTRWYKPAEALIMATSTNAELLGLSGTAESISGQAGRSGRRALADLLLVDGNPIDNIKLIEDPAKNFLVDHEGRKDLQEPSSAIRRVVMAGHSRPKDGVLGTPVTRPSTSFDFAT